MVVEDRVMGIKEYEGVPVAVGPICHEGGCRGYGFDGSDIVFIGIAPGRDEVKTGRPLTGPSGKMFDSILRGVGLDRRQVYCTNLICWYKDDPSPEEAEKCRSRLDQELRDRKPKLIVLLGKIVAEIFTGRDFAKVRGAVQWSDNYNCYILVSNHPAAILHSMDDQNDKGAIYDVVRDFRKIPDILKWEPGAPLAQIEYKIVDDPIEAQMVLDGLPRGVPIAIDVETTYSKLDEEVEIFEDKNEIRCLGVGTKDFAWVFTPTALYLPNGASALIWPNDLRWTMQNALFDVQVIRLKLGIWLNICEDTMLQSYSLDERGGKEGVKIHGLKQLSREYLAAPFYEEGKNKTLENLYEYNARDVVYTARLCDLFYDRQVTDNVRGFYERLLIPALNVYKEIQFRGARIDKDLHKQLAKEWITKLLVDEQLLQDEAEQLGWDGRLNINSPDQLSKFLFGVLGLPILKRTNKGKPSVDKEVIEKLEPQSDFVTRLKDVRHLSKMISTYITGFIDSLGSTYFSGDDLMLAHSKVRLHGTVCVNKDALIWTDRGLQYPDEIVVQDSGWKKQKFTVLSDNKTSELVTDTLVRLDVETRKISLGLGFNLICTPEHPFLTTRGWVRADDLTIDDYVKTNFGANYWPNGQGRESLFFLYGAFLSDGSIRWNESTGHYQVRFSNQDDRVRLEIHNALRKVYGDSISIVDSSTEIYFSNKEIVREWYSIFPEKGAYGKIIPNIIRTGSRNEVIEFIRGISLDSTWTYVSDGTNYHWMIRFSSVDEERLKVVHQFLWNLGIRSSLQNGEKDLSINRRTGSAPTRNRKYLKIFGIEAQKYIEIIGAVSYSQRDFAKAIEHVSIRNWGIKNFKYLNDTIYVKVLNNKLTNIKETVYDFTVPSTNAYTANGLIVHNTGRPAYSDLPLQLIPAAFMPIYGILRNLFIPMNPDTHVIVEADFGKAEIWCGYAYSQDPQLYADLTSGDFHSNTGVTVLGKQIDEITKQDRTDMKRVTFGIMYYIEANSLSKGIKRTPKEAQLFINNWFRRYSAYQRWFQEILATIKSEGEIVTKTGRKRRLIILGRNVVRVLKQAVNFPIQSTSSDVLLASLIDMHPKLEAIDAHVLFTVHDSIVSEVPKSKLKEAIKIIHDSMTNKWFDGVPPLPVEIKVGPNWGSCKPYHDCAEEHCLWEKPS